MSVRHRFGSLSDMVIRWRVVCLLDIGDQERLERLKARFCGDERLAISLALKLYARYALSELPTLFTRLPSGLHREYAVIHEPPPAVDEATAISRQLLVKWSVYRRLMAVRRDIGADDLVPVVRNALALLDRIAADDMPRLYARNGGGGYEPYKLY